MKLTALFYFILLTQFLSAQSFTEKTGTPFDGVWGSSIAFSDVDGDNDPDVLITGGNGSGTSISKLYTNNGTGNFTEKTSTPFVGVSHSSIAFSDVDGDNDQDVLITGVDNSSPRIAKLYTNDGMGNFTEKTGIPFDGVDAGSIAFSDVDGDNDPDVLITGNPGFPAPRIAKLYTNDGAGNFTEAVGTPFEGVSGGSIAFADVDGDGDPDALITGSGSSALISKLYANDGVGNFTEVLGTPFAGVGSSSIAFSDVDGDNDQDVLITGSDGSTLIAKLYTNDGIGNFTQKAGTPFDGVWLSSIAFSDVDGDNDPDVLITGFNSFTQIAKLYTNDGIGNFTEVMGTPFDGVDQGSIAFTDVDGDNDQDVLITGYYGAIIAKLYTNDLMGTSIDEVGLPQDNNILLYPNPSLVGEVYIDYLSEKDKFLKISMMNIEGRICYQQYSRVRHGSNNITVSYPALPNGWYIIKLDDGIRSRYGKLIVE